MTKQERPHMQGYLLKANKEHRKSSLLGTKYKKRWVQLTAETLVYAKSKQGMLTGQIQVFSMHEMAWVKSEGNFKFQVNFPERNLTFKVGHGDRAERDRWIEALESAKQLHLESHRQTNSADKLRQLQKSAAEQLLDTGSTTPRGSSAGSIPAYRGSAAAIAATATHNPIRQHLHSAGSVASRPPVMLQTSTHRVSDTGGGWPPSPRSLLASARAGAAFMNSTSDDGSSTPHKQSGNTDRLGCQQHVTESDNDETTDSGEYSASAGRSLTRNSLELTAAHTPTCGEKGNSRSHGQANSSRAQVSAGAGAGVDSTEMGAAGKSSGSTIQKRASLTRQPTPGVMLVNPSAVATPAAAASPEEHQLPHQHLAAALAVVDPTADEVLVLQQAHQPAASHGAQHYQQQHEHQHTQSRLHHSAASKEQPASSEQDLADEILRLDPDESASMYEAPVSKIYISKLHQQQQQQAVARPGSAPYRPGTPLKSCLRSSGGCGDFVNAEHKHPGSMSTSSGSTEAAAAAAVAAGKAVHNGRSGALLPSATPGIVAEGASEQVNWSSPMGKKDWLQDDWNNGESSDAEEQYKRNRDAHGKQQQASNSSFSGQAGGHSSRSLPPTPAGESGSSKEQCRRMPQAVDSNGAKPIGVRGAAHGVKADSNWLHDDFDD